MIKVLEMDINFKNEKFDYTILFGCECDTVI